MLIYNSDILSNIALHYYIENNLKKECIVKNNVLYTVENIELPKIKSIFIKNLDKYLFYTLNNNISNAVLCNINWEIKNKKNLNNYLEFDGFKFRERYFFSRGNMVFLLFSTPYINNPLDILFTINKAFELKGSYFDVNTDYIPFKDKIIYYIMFRYSGILEPNLHSIKEVKDNIMSFRSIKSEKSIFPKIQLSFELECFSGFERANSLENCLKYEGMSICSPYIHAINNF